jgi:hypothetical protein
MTRTTALVAACLLALGAACGGGGDEDAEAKDAIAQGLVREDFDRDAASCVADGLVDELGRDKLEEYGLITEDGDVADAPLTETRMSKEDAEEAADVIVDCVDVSEALEQLGPANELSPEVVDCLQEALGEDEFEALLTALLSGDQAGAMGAMGAAMECVAKAAVP